MKINIFLKIFLIIIVLVAVYFVLNKKLGREYYSGNNAWNTENIKNENKENTQSGELNLLFVGDAMFDRYIRKEINKYNSAEFFVNNFLTNLSRENQKYDYVIANLEGPITENKSKTLKEDGTFGKDLIFTFPPVTTQILNLLNIQVVSLANNHEDNFYNQGFQDTKNFLQKANINYFGNPYNDTLGEKISNIVCEKNICIAYIGYNQFTKYSDPEIVVKEIQKLKEDSKVDFIVVFAHFGEEYKLKANPTQINSAHKWITAGADLVIGTHPHVIQEKEIYKGKYIYYSLGNYIFDQWFDEDVSKGLGLNFEFSKDENGSKKLELIKEVSISISKENIKYLEN